jgi:hypothetical protein
MEVKILFLFFFKKGKDCNKQQEIAPEKEVKNQEIL